MSDWEYAMLGVEADIAWCAIRWGARYSVMSSHADLHDACECQDRFSIYEFSNHEASFEGVMP